jgi:hypothetical protein
VSDRPERTHALKHSSWGCVGFAREIFRIWKARLNCSFGAEKHIKPFVKFEKHLTFIYVRLILKESFHTYRDMTCFKLLKHITYIYVYDLTYIHVRSCHQAGLPQAKPDLEHVKVTKWASSAAPGAGAAACSFFFLLDPRSSPRGDDSACTPPPTAAALSSPARVPYSQESGGCYPPPSFAAVRRSLLTGAFNVGLVKKYYQKPFDQGCYEENL